MKKKIIKRFILLILFCVCCLILQEHRNLLLKNPFTRLAYSDIVFAAKDSKGAQIIIDSSGQRLIKVNSQQKVEFYLTGKKNSKGFYEAKRVITDEADNIYVLSLTADDGDRIAKEEIVEYSKNGQFLKVVYAINYKESVLVPKIIGLYSIRGEFAFIQKEDNSFDLYNKDAKKVTSYAYDNASGMIASVAIDKDGGNLYYSTLKGDIYRYVDGSGDKRLYSSTGVAYLSIPREVSCDTEGNVVFTDIGLRTVSSLDSKGNVTHRIYEGEITKDIADKYIYYYANASNGLIAVTSDYVAAEDGSGVTDYYGAAYTRLFALKIGGVWAALLLCSGSLLWLIAYLVLLTIRKGSKTLKTIFGYIIGILFVAGVFLLIVLPKFEGILIDALLGRAKVAANLTALMLPKESFKNIDEPSDYLGYDYKKVRDCLDSIYLSKDESVNDLYCVLYTIHDGIITCINPMEEDTGAIYPYDWEYEGSDEQWIMKHGEGLEYKSLSNSEGNFLFVLDPIFDSGGKTIGLIEVGTNLNSFRKETNRMILDLLLNVVAITIVVILVALEIIIFLSGRQKFKKMRASAENSGPFALPNELLRILVFGIFFVTNVTTSFLPLYAMKIAQNSGGGMIPKEVLAAIPISAEVAFGAIFSIFGNVVLKLVGQKRAVILGSIFISAGFFLRFIIPNIWMLTLGNCIMGSGWGIVLLIVNTVIAMGDEEEKNKGFSGYSAAALNGVNCGIVFGGFLSNWLNYTVIFIITFALSLLIFLYTMVYMTKMTLDISKKQNTQTARDINIFQFMKNKSVLKFFLLIVIPVISCSYFLNYMFPILASNYGLSETDTGYSYLLNGLCVICFSDVLTRYFTRKIKKEYSLVFSSFIYGAAFFVVAYYQNIYALLAALVLLGLSDSFGLPLQTSYFTDLEAVKKYGYEKSIGVYSLVENISQAGSSFVFSYVLICGVKQGLLIIIGIVAVLALLFGLSSVGGRKKNGFTDIAPL